MLNKLIVRRFELFVFDTVSVLIDKMKIRMTPGFSVETVSASIDEKSFVDFSVLADYSTKSVRFIHAINCAGISFGPDLNVDYSSHGKEVIWYHEFDASFRTFFQDFVGGKSFKSGPEVYGLLFATNGGGPIELVELGK